MKIPVEIFEEDVEGDCGFTDGLCAKCSLCGHQVEVLGQGDGSRRYIAVKLREECPRGENNYYDIGD
jgi:hypothetical protein